MSDKIVNFSARTPAQKQLIHRIINNQIIFVNGAAGTGKNCCASYLGVKFLREHLFDKLIITRPLVEAGSPVGTLPGDIGEKTDIYFKPIMMEIKKWSTKQDWALMRNQIECMPLSFMRGFTFDNSYIILDEAQNCSMSELKLFLTRIGKNSKYVILGDSAQSDLPPRDRGAFKNCCDLLYDLDSIFVHRFENSDIVRNPLITDILNRLENN